MPKYEMTSETITVDGHVLHRIRALRNVGIKDKRTGGVFMSYAYAEDLGGFIESEANLSQLDECWVSTDAMVYGNAFVCGCSYITGTARVHGDAIVDNSIIEDDTEVCGSVVIKDKRVTATGEQSLRAGKPDPADDVGGISVDVHGAPPELEELLRGIFEDNTTFHPVAWIPEEEEQAAFQAGLEELFGSLSL